MKLSSKQRKQLPDSDFGLIIDGERKYPMHDKRHVILAIRMFKHCPSGKEQELANKINSKMKEFGIKVKPSGAGAFMKYAKPDSLTCSDEAWNVGTLEPIVGGTETLRPYTTTAVRKLEIPEGAKKMLSFFNEEGDFKPAEESCQKPKLNAQLREKEADIPLGRGIRRAYDYNEYPYSRKVEFAPESVLGNIHKVVMDLVTLGEYNDAKNYCLDKHPVYGIASWMLKDEIVELYYQDYDEDMKALDMAYIIGSQDTDTKKYLLACLYLLDDTSDLGLLNKTLDNIATVDCHFKSFLTPAAPDTTFGPFDQNSHEYDYPEKFNYDPPQLSEYYPTYALNFDFIPLICKTYGFEPIHIETKYILRLIGAELVDKNVIDGYDASRYSSDVLLYKDGDDYGFVVVSDDATLHMFSFPKDIWAMLTGEKVYGESWEKEKKLSKYLDYARHWTFKTQTDYKFEEEFDHFKNKLDWTLNMIDEINDTYNLALDSIEKHETDMAKDALATLFTTSRILRCDNTVSPDVTSGCNFKCRDLLKKIYSLESSFNFLKFYKEAGYEFYTEGMNAISPSMAYNLVMGI